MKHHVVIILKNNGKFLFVQRAATKKSLPNIWAFPSGTIEAAESPEQAVVREAKEELDIEVAVKRKIAEVELSELGAHLHFIFCSFNPNARLVCDPAEIQDIKWLTFEEFFNEYSDEQIGHGLVYLRKHPKIWEEI